MTVLDGVRVEASAHAIDAGFRRVPVLKGADERGARRWIERTAAKGILAQRSAKRLPRWATRGLNRPWVSGESPARFVWNETEDVVFLCRLVRMYVMRNGERLDVGQGWLVVTVIRRAERVS